MDRCKFRNHFVLYGWTEIGEVALEELLMDDNQIAVITDKKDDVPTIKRKGGKKSIFPIYGDPSKTEILNQANIGKASVVILCMKDDSKNLITALHIKDKNPSARLIVKTIVKDTSFAKFVVSLTSCDGINDSIFYFGQRPRNEDDITN